MAFELPQLPYEKKALEPHISEETLEYHFEKHHKGYANKLNGLIPGTSFESASLEKMIMEADGTIFNNAAQVWNHNFYWNSMSPNGGGNPGGKLAAAIEIAFGSLDKFKEKFTDAGMTQFGSGWAWLVQDSSGTLTIKKTLNAGNPMTDSHKPLFTCDVWEHAYYIDTRNDRARYISNFWNIINWNFAEKNMENI